MAKYVALLRGINVGGKNIVPMQEFRDLLTRLECVDAVTYIQSGNAVFQYSESAASLNELIADEIESVYGFRPAVMVFARKVFADIAAANPYKTDDPKQVHTLFLGAPAVDADLSRMNALATSNEHYSLTDKALYFHAPNGIGRSRFAAGVEKCLGVSATGRNARTVGKIVELMD